MTHALHYFGINLRSLGYQFKRRGCEVIVEMQPDNKQALVNLKDRDGNSHSIKVAYPDEAERSTKIDWDYNPPFDPSSDDTERFINWIENPLRLLGMVVWESSNENVLLISDAEGVMKRITLKK